MKKRRKPGASLTRKPKPARPGVSLAERLDRRALAIQFIESGLTFEQALRQFANHGVTADAARRVYDDVLTEMRNGQDEHLKDARVRAIRRISRDLAALRNPGQLRDRDGELVFEAVKDARGKPTKEKRAVAAPIDYQRIVQHERLLAQIEGTMKPIEVKIDVDVTMRRAMLAVVSSLTPDRIDELAADDEERERKALGQGG